MRSCVIRVFAWVRPLVAVSAALWAVGCSAPLIPPARLPKETRKALPDNALLESLRRDWLALARTDMPEAQRQELISRYNKNLLILLKRYRVDVLSRSHEPEHTLAPFVELVADAPLREIYDDIVPSSEIRFDILEEHYTVPGIGVPLVGVIPAEKAEKLKEVHTIHTKGTVRNLTAVLEFPRAGKPRLHLIPRNRQESFLIGRLNYGLAGDFSAAIELYWDLTRIDESRILGMLRPQELRDITGLSCLEGYDPGKIPVVFTHGLLSSAGTFTNLANRLINDPEIRRNYQFWYFNYPTGVSWTVSAAAYRRALRELRDEVDPGHTNRNWDEMVVIGHSMGGLITHYSQCCEPWLLLEDTDATPHLKSYLCERYVDTPFEEEALNALRPDYFFRPVEAGMVVYMATPHQGAPLARYRLAAFVMRLVQLPQNLVEETLKIATLQRGSVVFNPAKLTQWFTSVNQLSPDSYSIRGLKRLKVRDVPTYSVIGNPYKTPLEKSSDGVVPYWSSHIPWGEEKVVASDHSVQDAPETARYVRGILTAYLRKVRAKR